MIVIDTPNCTIVSSHDTVPNVACVGRCKRVWWFEDTSENQSIHRCAWCAGDVEEARKNVHFRVYKRQGNKSAYEGLIRLSAIRIKKSNFSVLKLKCNVTVEIL